MEALASNDLGLASTIRAIQRLERRLARPLRVAILGEFNAGKSTLANVLAGIDSLPTAVVSATRFPTLLCRARAPKVWALHYDGRREMLRADSHVNERSVIRLEVGLPLPWLDTVQILDLPGLSDPNFRASPADLAADGVDALIWCTVSTQAWKESERDAWGQLPYRLQSRSMLVATHADLLRSDQDRERLFGRLQAEVGPYFSDVVMYSARARTEASEAPLRAALHRLLEGVRQQRNEAALRVTARLSGLALARLPDSA